MGKIRTILIPIDFSDASINALSYGIEMAKIHVCDICLLHAYRLFPPHGNDEKIQVGALKKKINTEIESKLKALLDYHVQPKGVNAHFTSQIGFPDDVIESYISKNKMDLIIMGTTGEDNSSSTFGNTLSSVVNISSIPILAIPLKVNFKKWKHVFSHTNNDKSYKPKAIELANDPNIVVSENEYNGEKLEEIIFGKNIELDLYAIDNIEYGRIEKKLNRNNTNSLKQIPRPLLIHF